MNEDNVDILQQALYELLLPLARLNLHYGLSTKAFTAISKQAYVDAARADFGIRGRPTNKARIAALTGLTRAEVQRLLDNDSQTKPLQSSPLQRVVSLWLRESSYQNQDGSPAPIPLDGCAVSFTALVSQCGGDIPWQTLLKELLRLGIVEQRGEQLSLIKNGYLPQHDDIKKLPFLGSEVSSLIDTIAHNLRSDGEDLRFQRKVAFEHLSAEGVTALQQFAEQKGQALLVELDQLLSQYSVENPQQQTEKTDSHYAGLGMFVFDRNRD